MNTVLFGNGRWGKILKKNIESRYNLKKIFDSKSNIDDFNYSIIDWAIVASSNISHYEIVKFLLNKNINVFCEKPMTMSFKETKELIGLSEVKKLKIFVNHIYKFKKKDIKLKKINNIKRSKKSNNKTFQDIIFDLFYHDLYLILPFLDLNDLIFSGFIFKNKSLFFQIKSNYKTYKFEYDMNSEKFHKINNVNFIDEIDYIPEILEKAFNFRLNYNENNLEALNCSFIIDKILSLNTNKLCSTPV